MRSLVAPSALHTILPLAGRTLLEELNAALGGQITTLIRLSRLNSLLLLHLLLSSYLALDAALYVFHSLLEFVLLVLQLILLLDNHLLLASELLRQLLLHQLTFLICVQVLPVEYELPHSLDFLLLSLFSFEVLEILRHFRRGKTSALVH